MKRIEFQCCFCGEGITRTAVDPCAIVLIANWQSHESQQAEQQFFCHVACFKAAMWPNVPVEVEESLAEDHE